MQKVVKVIESVEGKVLFECSMEEIEKAYLFAKEMEAMDIDVEIKSPSVPESLAIQLGVSSSSIADLKQEIEDEIDSHDLDSCCVKKGDLS